MKKKYEKLKEQYPEYISKLQLHKICGVSPRTASYLLDRGIIPSIDTGRTTWRYKIKLDDVIVYLQQRDKVGSMIPPGAVSSRCKHQKEQQNEQRQSYAALVSHGKEKDLAEYLSFIYADFPDVLTAMDLAEMTGFHKETIYRLIRKGAIETFGSATGNGRKHLILKSCLIQYLSSPAFIESRSNSEMFQRVLGGFSLWLAVK